MKNNIKYIELKTGFNDNGPAWIGKVEFSKSKNTIYFNGQAFKKSTGYAYAYSHYSNYFDIETKEEYWISGIKINGTDRHWAGSGKIMIDKDIVNEYMQLVGLEILDLNKFELIDTENINKEKFYEIENKLKKIIK